MQRMSCMYVYMYVCMDYSSKHTVSCFFERAWQLEATVRMQRIACMYVCMYVLLVDLKEIHIMNISDVCTYAY